MTQAWFRLLLVATVSAVAGCSEPVREAQMKDKNPNYPPEIREAIDKGYLVKGMDATQVEAALGRTPCIKTRSEGGKTFASWAYAINKTTYKVSPPATCFQGEYAPYTVLFEDGHVTNWDY